MEIYKAFCLDVAQGHMKGAPNETSIEIMHILSYIAYHCLMRHIVIMNHNEKKIYIYID